MAWCRADGRDPLWLAPEAGEGYLAHLLEAQTRRSAHARFATFQIAAGLAWGPEASAHLALALRASRVTKKAAPADRWGRAERGVAKLPAAWQPAFRQLLEVSRDAPETRRTLIWSAARIGSVASALARFSDFAARAGANPVPTATLCQAWAESLVWMPPGVQRESGGSRGDRVRSCVRPRCAALDMAAGRYGDTRIRSKSLSRA